MKTQQDNPTVKVIKTGIFPERGMKYWSVELYNEQSFVRTIKRFPFNYKDKATVKRAKSDAEIFALGIIEGLEIKSVKT